MASITLRRPDDWHVHFRDGAVLRAVVPFTARRFGRAIVMPNLTPPVTTAAMASAYRERVRAAIPAGVAFTPLMTCYLTDATDAGDLIAGHRDGIFTAAKLYPANATTNSSHGVTEIAHIFPVLAAMERAGMPLLVHGEVNDQTVDIFDREAVFIERVLDPTRRRFPGLKVVMEHVTTREAVDYVRGGGPQIGATVTPQHLMINRNAIFRGGIRPHYYCLPVAKREVHRLAVRAAATSGDPSFFLGTDTAPHLRHLKEAECGCAGLFNAPAALECYATVFAQENALDKLEAFASLNGPAFYGLPPNQERVTLTDTAPTPLVEVAVAGEGSLRAFGSDEALGWSVVEDTAA